MNADIDKIQVDGKQVVVIRQGDYGLYYCDHAVYLENGTGYQLNAAFPDYSQLLDQVVELYRRMDITAENGEYVIFTSGQDAQELLQILTPTLADQISDLSDLEVRLATENERLKQVRFRSEGTLKGKSYRLNAKLDILGTSEAVVPEPVRSAIVNGTAQITMVVTEDLIALANAWNTLDSKELLCADLALSADCGPLKLSEQLEFYRDTSGGQTIYSLQKNGYGLYFTDNAVCDRNGLAVSTEQAQLADSARLLDLAYELCQSADVSVSNGVYTVTLDENGMTRAACAIAPQTAEMDIAYKEGAVQLRLSNGEIESVRFAISGSVKVVVAEVPASLTGQLTPSATQRGFTVPEAVRKTLEK